MSEDSIDVQRVSRSKELPVDFDANSYLALNPDLQKAAVDPIEHYLLNGCKEGREYTKAALSLRPILTDIYDSDGLKSMHNHDFMINHEFLNAYKRGVQAAQVDYNWQWRVHIGLWAARSAMRISGDFVECGVNRGFMSSAIMEDLKWSSTGRIYYLLDTFHGLDERFISEKEKQGGAPEKNSKAIETGYYTNNPQSVEKNFSEWSNVKIIVGSIPETLPQITSKKIAFLHIDLNCSPPEIATLEFLWNRLETGGIVLLDDYAYYGYQLQKEGVDDWAVQKKVPVASLPTGQGLIIKA